MGSLLYHRNIINGYRIVEVQICDNSSVAEIKIWMTTETASSVAEIKFWINSKCILEPNHPKHTYLEEVHIHLQNELLS